MPCKIAGNQKAKIVFSLMLCLFFCAGFSGSRAIAADPSGDERLELKRSDLDDVKDASCGGPEGKPEREKSANQAGSEHEGAQASPAYDRSPMVPSATRSDNTEEEPENSAGVRTPFNLGVRKSVIDAGAGDNNTQLKGGTAGIQDQFPALSGSANSAALKAGASTNGLKGGLTKAQLQRLANHDLVLIIDQSGSMQTRDCPVSGVGRVGGAVMGMLLGSAASVSRWQWCRDQTMQLAEQTRYVSAKGLSVVLFSGQFAVYPHVTLAQIPTIFAQAAPKGGTNLTDPLRATISDYYNRKRFTAGNVKPLAIAIITDGLPNNQTTVCQAIVEATHYMRDPREITVTFFLIGNSAFNGQAFVTELERNLPRYGARYSIVRSVSFWTLMKVGLARALADALE